MPTKIQLIDYKKELEAASKGMILVHDPKTLIKLIVRMIVRKVKIKHAGMVLYDPKKKVYVLTISRGQKGLKIPAGFTRLNPDNPLIQLFTHPEYRNFPFRHSAIVLDDLNRLIWQESIIGIFPSTEVLHRAIDQMQMFNTVACVPAYYHDTLLAVLLLGAKSEDEPFESHELDFFAALASDVAMAIKNAQLFIDLKSEADRNRNLFLQTTLVLASTIEAKDQYTRGHTERVTNYSLAIARHMMETGLMQFNEKFFEDLQVAGLMHDIGKIAIPESILRKTEKLTPEEFELMKTHTVRGVEILKPLAHEFKESMKGVRSHHERYDGKGYPDGLRGDQIPIMAAIIAVADTFDAMTSDRPYRKGLSKSVAIEEIRRNSGVQFNPLVVQAMMELAERGVV